MSAALGGQELKLLLGSVDMGVSPGKFGYVSLTLPAFGWREFLASDGQKRLLSTVDSSDCGSTRPVACHKSLC
jgi:hypothetical protein